LRTINSEEQAEGSQRSDTSNGQVALSTGDELNKYFFDEIVIRIVVTIVN